MDTKSIITISRQYGSGGRFIGRKLANKLGIPFYDQELISLAAKESGFSEGFFENAEKKATSSFLYSLYLHGTVEGNSGLPLDEQAFIIQSGVILDVAKKGPCVIVGRCADYVLEGAEGLVRVFLYADMEYREKRISDLGYYEPRDIRKNIKRIDRERRDYHRYYTGRDWENVENYDLMLNTASLGTEGAMEAIRAYLRIKEYEL